MKTEEIRDLAIKRHDIDANHFQSVYTGGIDEKANVFLYGRGFILEELDRELKNVPDGGIVLDIGSGTGHLTKSIQEKGFEVKGVEPSIEMIGHARKNFPDIEFKEGISSKIPYDDNTFDFIVAFEVLRYLDRKENEESYREFLRVLKPGGRIFITHVNKYALDFYFLFHPIKGMLYKLINKTHHNCYFTYAGKEEKIVKKLDYSKVASVGVLNATTRIAFKLGSSFGRFYIRIIEALFGRNFYRNNLRNFCGHLILTGEKKSG